MRARRILRRELDDGLRRATHEAAREAERRVITERLAIARDLHDVPAHSVAVIGVQANVAAELFDADPARWRTAIDTIRTAGGEALADLGRTIRVLRVGADLEPVRGIDDVPALVEGSRRTGLHTPRPCGSPWSIDRPVWTLSWPTTAAAPVARRRAPDTARRACGSG